MPIPPLWLICGSLTFLAGVLVVLGWRGRRVGDHRYCRRCGYDLFGCEPTTTACPECGADLARRRAVHVGLRQHRWKVLTVGVLLLLLAGGIVGTDYWLHSKGRTWYSIAPERVLFAFAKHAGDPEAVETIQELILRFEDGELTPSNHAMLFELLIDTSRGVHWNPSHLEELAEHGYIPQSRWRQVLADQVVAGFRVREKVGRDRPVVLIQPYSWPRLELDNDQVMADVLYLDGNEWRRYTQSRWHPDFGLYQGDGWYGPVTTEGFTPQKVPPGKYILRLEQTHWRYHRQFGSEPSTLFTVPSRDFHIEVVDADTTVELVMDDRLAKAFHDFVAGLNEYYFHRLGELVVDMPGHLVLVYDVIARTSDQEVRVATLRHSPGYSHVIGYGLSRPLPATVDVIFRPNIEAAEKTPDIYRILGNEIIVENVPSSVVIPP